MECSYSASLLGWADRSFLELKINISQADGKPAFTQAGQEEFIKLKGLKSFPSVIKCTICLIYFHSPGNDSSSLTASSKRKHLEE